MINDPDCNSGLDHGEDDSDTSVEASRWLCDESELAELRRPQGPDSGINAIIGKWPGDETDEEVFRILEEMS